MWCAMPPNRASASVALLYPQTQYGSNVQQALDRSAARQRRADRRRPALCARQAGIAAAQRIAQDINDPSRAHRCAADPGRRRSLRSLSADLEQNGITPQKVTILGTGLWDDSVTRSTPIAQGGWYAGVSPELVGKLQQQIFELYGSKPAAHREPRL